MLDLAEAMLSPLARVGRGTLEIVADLGRMATLLGLAVRSLVRPGEDAAPLRPALIRQLAGLLGMGLPLVALVHVGMGSFLSLQAYFGGTFVDGTGAVVGVGLIRNVAPMMAGLIMAGLIAARTTSELRTQPWEGLDGDPLWIADRDAAHGTGEGGGGLPPELRRVPEPPRLAAVRISAAVLAGPILALWGVIVGTVVGWQVSQTMLGVSTHGFFSMMTEMLWLRDVAGLIVKGCLYALLASLFACHEGLRRPAVAGSGSGSAPAPAPAHGAVAMAAFRAACLSSVAILVINSGWFLLVYHAGPAFGPTLMNP
jgi:phospholipid/cholesterol/gamma-HCH transport system permease protein